MDVLLNNLDLVLLLAQVGAVALLATVIGFLLARWMYRAEAASRNTLLQQEIMRLRRKLSDREAAQQVVERNHQRTRRQSRGQAAA
ncbi:MAG: hypothetical protein NW215_07675 [Hyphomicrobiales bacterium]|nr:hypothetical protein [Hyphomicrobiales bacterium]